MSDPGPTPHDDEVRRLLRDARAQEPVPADVAARLDAALAELRAEGRAQEPAGPPADLAAARRRRTRIRNAVLAAAAVVVIGYGVSQVDLTSQGSADSSSAGSGSAADQEAKAARPVVDLDPAHFDRQVRRLVRRSAAGNNAGPDSLTTSSSCDDPAWGAGRRVAVRYDGAPGVLVLRAPRDDQQVVDLFLCGERAATRSTTVAAP